MNPNFPAHLPPLPPLPPGFDRWVYLGLRYGSPVAIMVTSFDETMDTEWDPPEFFQTVGDDHTHYAQAVIDHHHICECEDCTHSSPAPDSTLIVCADSETQKTVMDRLRPSDTAMKLETETMTNPNSKDALRALANKLQLQRDALANDLFANGLGTERTKQARCETYLRLIAKGFPHDEARDAANQLVHVG